jgi:hypothetical protein
LNERRKQLPSFFSGESRGVKQSQGHVHENDQVVGGQGASGMVERLEFRSKRQGLGPQAHKKPPNPGDSRGLAFDSDRNPAEDARRHRSARKRLDGVARSRQGAASPQWIQGARIEQAAAMDDDSSPPIDI